MPAASKAPAPMLPSTALSKVAADDAPLPYGATIILVGHFATAAGSSAMGRYAPPIEGAPSSAWICEHNAAVTLTLVDLSKQEHPRPTLAGGKQFEWRVSRREAFAAAEVLLFTASVEADVAALLDMSEESAWTAATSTLTSPLRWNAIALDGTSSCDPAVRARCVTVDKKKKLTNVVVHDSAKASAKALAARAKNAAEKRENPAAHAAKQAKIAAAAEKKAARAAAMKKRKNNGDDDEEFDYAQDWFPPPLTEDEVIAYGEEHVTVWAGAGGVAMGSPPMATKSAPPPKFALCAYCKPYNCCFSLMSMLGGGIEGASSIALYWLVFRFVSSYLGNTKGTEERWNNGMETTIALACIGFFAGVGVFLNHTLLPISLENQMETIRIKFMRQALSQEVAWYDLSKGATSGLASTLDGGITAWKSAIGQMGLPQLGTAFGAFSMSTALMFTSSWRVTLIVLALFPIMVLTMVTAVTTMMIFMGKMMSFMASMGSSAGETLSGIRTLISLQNEKRVLAEHRAIIVKKNKNACANSMLFAVVFGTFFAVQFVIIAFSVLAGGALLVADRRAVVHIDAVAKWSSGESAADSLSCAFGTTDISVLTDWSVHGMSSIGYDLSNPSKESMMDMSDDAAMIPALCNTTLACDSITGTCISSLPCEAECVKYIASCLDGTTCITGTEIAQTLIIFFFGLFVGFGSIMAIKAVAEGGEAAKKVLHITERTPKIVAYSSKRFDGGGGAAASKVKATTDTADGVSRFPEEEEEEEEQDAAAGEKEAEPAAAVVVEAAATGAAVTPEEEHPAGEEDADVTGMSRDGLTQTAMSASSDCADGPTGDAEASGDVDDEAEPRENDEEITSLVRFENVRFRYPSRPLRCVLDSVSFTIEKGKQTAFVGASGSGKSTVMQLLLRFYDPDSGRVLLNGEPLPVYDVHSLRDEIGVVGQEPKLFEARVWENVAWGARTELLDQLGDLSLVQDFASLLTMSDGHKQLHASVITACTTAQAHKFIMRDLADGYDQLLLEGGRAVSGGQKQRLAIARALVRRPSILLLDEATSALDSESERRVQAALEKDLKESGLTMVLIAHRLSTLAHCDTVIVLDTGMIVERGSYAELASKEDGHFKTMLAEQGIVAAEGEGDGAAAAPALPSITRQASLSDAAEENLKGKIANVDEENNNKKEDDQEEALTLLSGARTGFGVVCCTPLETRFYFIISTIVGVFAQPMIMMSMMIQLVVLAVIYSDANTNNTDTVKWWMFIEMLLSSLLIWFLAVSWYTPMFRAFGGLADSFRDRAYSALLRQDVSFFDKSENSVGVLTLLLAGDAESASVRICYFLFYHITEYSSNIMIFINDYYFSESHGQCKARCFSRSALVRCTSQQ